MSTSSRQFEEIKSWLINDLKYPQYVKVFEDNGFDRWDILSELQIVHFFQLTGIKQGHAIRLHHALQSMQVKKEEVRNKFQYRKDAKLTQKTIDIALNSMLNSLKNIIEKYEWKLQRNINCDENVNIEGIEQIINDITRASNNMVDEMMTVKDTMQSQMKQIAETLSKKYEMMHDDSPTNSVEIDLTVDGIQVTNEYVNETDTFEVNNNERKYDEEEEEEHGRIIEAENEKKSRSNETNENFVVVSDQNIEQIPFDVDSGNNELMQRAVTLPALLPNQKANLIGDLNIGKMPSDDFQDKVLQRLSQKLQDLSDQYNQNQQPFQSNTVRVSGGQPKYYERSHSAKPYRRSKSSHHAPQTKKRSMISNDAFKMKKVTVFKGHQSHKRRKSLHSRSKKKRANTSRKST